jgi:dienelactone hydrolase
MNISLLRLRSALLLVCLAASTFGAAQANAQSPYIANVPFSTPYYTYTVQSDIVYGQGEVNGGGTFKDLKLDIYIPDIPPPETGTNQMPLMVMLHGGGFTSGNKASPDVVSAAREYAQRGWLVASINYRKIPSNPVPSARVQALYDFFGGVNATDRDRARVAAIDDTLTALDFLQARNDVKKSWTTLWGTSAGGNTVLGAGFALDDHGIPRPPVAVVVEVAGRFEGAAIDNPFDSPASGDPVLISIIGTADELYPYSLETEAWAIEAGLPFDFEVIEGAGHPPDLFNDIASTGVILFQRTVDWQHETVFAGLDQGPQPPPGC